MTGRTSRVESSNNTPNDDAAVLARLEAYYDLAPRATSDVEEHGPLTLFVARTGWPFYARPTIGEPAVFTAAHVSAVLDRQRELEVPLALEWVVQTSPTLLAAALDAGMSVEQCPLLVLHGPPHARTVDSTVRLVPADDPDLPLVRASIHVGFGTLGTAVGAASVAERDEEVRVHPESGARVAAQVAAGTSVLVGAFDPSVGAVGGGSHNPRGQVSEIAGVAVLPAYRRRGLAGAITALLAQVALDRGVTTVFCSAQDDDVARVYESVGFRRIGTACVAEVG